MSNNYHSELWLLSTPLFCSRTQGMSVCLCLVQLPHETKSTAKFGMKLGEPIYREESFISSFYILIYIL